MLDEVHEAFDHEYRTVLEDRVSTLRARGGIVIAAGHDHAMLGRLCDRAFLLGHGDLRATGPLGAVVERYLQG